MSKLHYSLLNLRHTHLHGSFPRVWCSEDGSGHPAMRAIQWMDVSCPGGRPEPLRLQRPWEQKLIWHSVMTTHASAVPVSFEDRINRPWSMACCNSISGTLHSGECSKLQKQYILGAEDANSYAKSIEIGWCGLAAHRFSVDTSSGFHVVGQPPP